MSVIGKGRGMVNVCRSVIGIGDDRYVNVDGDTMTGALTINPTSGNDALTVDNGFKVNFGTNTYLQYDGVGTLNLYVNDELLDFWATTSSVPETGSPIGLLLALTYNVD